MSMPPECMIPTSPPCTAPKTELSSLLSALTPILSWCKDRQLAQKVVMGPIRRIMLQQWRGV